MHLSDALISTPVAVGGGVISATLIAIASKKVKEINRPDIVPLMGVMGAFLFAAQMINFAIPGTGSSGHLIGGILLSAVLGPWAAFLTLSSVLIVQCLFFADGGIMALGCNILNMGAMACLVAFPLIYQPIAGNGLKKSRIIAASVISSIAALELGALFVTLETVFSGVTALPFLTFIKFMLPIHVAIGAIEGLVTAFLIIFIANYRPEALYDTVVKGSEKEKNKALYWLIGSVTLLLAGAFTFLASDKPDGLEWSVEKSTDVLELTSNATPLAIMPEYNSAFAGIVGVLIMLVCIWGVSSLLLSRKRQGKNINNN